MPRTFTLATILPLICLGWVILQECEAAITITAETAVTEKGASSVNLTCSYLPITAPVERVRWIKHKPDGNPVEVYSWFFLTPGTAYDDLFERATHNSPSGTAVLTIQNVTASDSANYTCKITENSVPTSASLELTVKIPPSKGPYIDFDNSGNLIHDVSSVNATEGGDSIFICKVEGINPQATITWSRKGGAALLSGEETVGSTDVTYNNVSYTYDVSRNLTIRPGVSHLNAITYQCTVSGIALNGDEVKNVTVQFGESSTPTSTSPEITVSATANISTIISTNLTSDISTTFGQVQTSLDPTNSPNSTNVEQPLCNDICIILATVCPFCGITMILLVIIRLSYTYKNGDYTASKLSTPDVKKENQTGRNSCEIHDALHGNDNNVTFL